MRLVADSVGVATPLRRAAEKTADPLEAYLALARGSAARARRITLAPGWWRRDGPSFAGVTNGDGRPIAVLSDGRGRYRAVDPAAERSFRVGRREAAGIAAEGVMLHPPFPARVRGVAAALGHAVGAVTGDLRSVLFMSVLSSIVGLATPVLTGHLLASAIPRSDTPIWIAGLAALFLCALGAVVFQVVQTFALLRIERALARKPRILLLDEATSALDNHTQSVVQDALGKLSITRIVIAHRLSTVRDVDRIHVLDRGRIAESGRYDDLIARDGSSRSSRSASWSDQGRRRESTRACPGRHRPLLGLADVL